MQTTHSKILVIGIIIPLLLYSCKKDPLVRPSITMESVSRIDVNSLELRAEVNFGTEIFPIKESGFFLIAQNGAKPTCEDQSSYLKKIPADINDDKLIATIEDLDFATLYEVYAYVLIEYKGENKCIVSPFSISDVTGTIAINSNYRIENTIVFVQSIVTGLAENNTVEMNGILWTTDSLHFPTTLADFNSTSEDFTKVVFDVLLSDVKTSFDVILADLPKGQKLFIKAYALYNEELILGNELPIFIGNYWEILPALNDSPGDLYESVSFVIEDKAYVGTGIRQSFSSTQIVTNDFWEYNALEHTWTQKADVPGGVRTNAFGFAANDKGYIGGGESQANASVADKQDVWEYHPSDNSWTEKMGFAKRPAQPSGSNRSKAVTFVINNRPFVAHGVTGSGLSSWVFEFLPDDIRNGFNTDGVRLGAWIRKASIANSMIDGETTGRMNAVGFSIENRGYLGYGVKSTSYSNTFFEYDPDGGIEITETDEDGNPKGLWRKMNSNGIYRQKAMSFVIGDYAYMGGGGNLEQEGVGPTYKDWWRFDPRGNGGDGEWTQLTDIGLTNRDSATGFALHGKGYIYGGLVAENLFNTSKDLLIYTPSK